MKRFFSAAEIDALPVHDRVRAETAISVAHHTPGLTAQFVFEYLLQDLSACGEWLGQMIEYYETHGLGDVRRRIQNGDRTKMGCACQGSKIGRENGPGAGPRRSRSKLRENLDE